MNDFDLVRKNLFRRKLRASLMIVSILIAFMIFGVLAGFYRAFTAGEDAAAADRMITVSRCRSPTTIACGRWKACGR